MLFLGIGCTGCSFMTVRSRSTTGSTTSYGGNTGCTRSYRAPVSDTSGVVGNLAGMAVFSALAPDQKSDAQQTVATAYLTTTGVLAGVLVFSAIYGYSVVSECNRSEDALPASTIKEVMGNAPPASETAGFHLGGSPVDAREACTSSGRVWADTDGGSVCKGPAKPPIGAQTTRLYFKATRLAIIEAEVHPPGDDVESWSGAFRDLQRTLKERYGAPVEKSLELPDECKPSEAFMQCLEDGKIRGTTRWSLQNGMTVLLSVAPENGAGIIRVRFSARDASSAGPQVK